MFEVYKNKDINNEPVSNKSLVNTEPRTTILKPQEIEYSFNLKPRSDEFNEIVINLIKTINNIDTIKNLAKPYGYFFVNNSNLPATFSRRPGLANGSVISLYILIFNQSGEQTNNFDGYILLSFL